MFRDAAHLCLFSTFLAASAWAQPPIASDFPPQDYAIVMAPGRDGGRALTAALRTRPVRASALDVLLQHRFVDESLAVLSEIVTADDSELLPALKAATQTRVWWDDQKRHDEIGQALAAIAERAMAAAVRRPRDEAAEIVREILWLQATRSRRTTADWAEQLRAFVASYAGTPAALDAEVELMERTLTVVQRVEEGERFAREHPGTVAGARALFQAAFHLGTNYAITGIEPRGSDPTDRLLRVAAMARELESGRYPACEWVARAPTLVAGFFVPDTPPPSYAPGNAQRSLDEYASLVRSHLAWRDRFPPNDPIAHMVSYRMWRLWGLMADPIAAAERFFDELAAAPESRARARLLQARVYIERVRESGDDAAWSRTRAIALLTDLARGRGDDVGSRAHAMLAAELFVGGDDREACQEFRRFVEARPQSDWAWVASLRVGQCEEALRNPQAAVDAYQRAVALHPDRPVAVLLGHAFAARVLEGTGNITAALREYQQALAAWVGHDSTRHALTTWRRSPSNDATFVPNAFELVKPALASRQEQLRTVFAAPGGALLERARWLLRRGSRSEARAAANELRRRFPRSPLVRDAGDVVHRADYEDALDLAAADSPRDVTAALERLERLSREADGVIVGLAGIARASITAVRSGDGDGLMRGALENWRASQVSPPPAAAGSLEADAYAVRQAVFQPLGGGIYQTRWNAMVWPRTLPPFLMAPATLPVHEASGRVTIVQASHSIPGLENMLYLSQEDFDLLAKTIGRLGGNLRRVPASVMATPNQPAGASETIMRLWNRFFPMRPGHWGGWDLATFPVIARIEFTNPERTKASVPVTVGYSGGTILLEKSDGQWRATAIVNRWIT